MGWGSDIVQDGVQGASRRARGTQNSTHIPLKTQTGSPFASLASCLLSSANSIMPSVSRARMPLRGLPVLFWGHQGILNA